MLGDRAVGRDIQILFETGTAGGLGDRQLLDRFAAGDDEFAEAAFEVLLLRHGPMALRACRNLLRNSNDAEDAFQATFLVLLRRPRARSDATSPSQAGSTAWPAASRPCARVDAASAEPLSIGRNSGSSRRSVPSDVCEAGRLESDILVQDGGAATAGEVSRCDLTLLLAGTDS